MIKQASTPNVTAVTAAFSNSNSDSLNNFDFKIAVPKYVKLQVNPPSGNVVPASNSGSVTQSFKLLNTLHGEVIHFFFFFFF